MTLDSPVEVRGSLDLKAMFQSKTEGWEGAIQQAESILDGPWLFAKVALLIWTSGFVMYIHIQLIFQLVGRWGVYSVCTWGLMTLV